jgi:drug/metabolite transporter (DMT)-like permease
LSFIAAGGDVRGVAYGESHACWNGVDLEGSVMSRRGWLLFSALSVIWGIPYLLIKVAMEEVSPEFLVFARTAVGALILVPVAARRGWLRPALRAWRPVLAFAAIEIGGAWLLLNNAEERMTSSLAGLLIAMVPLIGTLIAWGMGDRSVLSGTRLIGLLVGLVGVAAVVGLNLAVGATPVLAVVAMVGVAICYSVAPMITDRKLGDVPALGVIAVSLAAVAIVYAPAAVFSAPHSWPSARVLGAMLTLGIVCTVAAFLVFFALIAEVGAVRAMVITYVNPAIALLLGAGLLGETVTTGMIIGLPLILLGSFLATRRAKRGELSEPGIVGMAVEVIEVIEIIEVAGIAETAV